MAKELKIVRSPGELEELREIWEPLQWNPYWDLDYLLWKYAQPWCDESAYAMILLRADGKPVVVAGEIRQIPVQFQIGYKRWKGPTLKTLFIQRYGLMGESDEAVWWDLRDHLEQLLVEKEVEAVLLRGFDVTQQPHTLSFERLPAPCRDGIRLVQEHWSVDCPEGLLIHKRKHPSFWKHVRNARNRISREYSGCGQVRRYWEPTEVDLLLAHTEQVARKTWQRKLGGGDFASDQVKGRFWHFASRGLLRARVLYLGGEPAAFSHGLEYVGKLYWEVMGYDPAYWRLGVGTYLTSTLIEDCLSGNPKPIDCGVGNSEAKKLFCDRFFSAADLFLVAPTPRLMALNRLRVSFLRVHLCLKRALSRGGLYHKVRSKWRYGAKR